MSKEVVAKVKKSKVVSSSPPIEKVFPNTRIKLFCLKTVTFDEGQATQVKRVEPEAITLLRKECQKFTDEIISASSRVMKSHNRTFSPSIVHYVLKSMGMRIPSETNELVFSHTLFRKYVSSKFETGVPAVASESVQYAVESRLNSLVQTALLFVIVSGKLTFGKKDVVAALTAKQQQIREMYERSFGRSARRKSESKKSESESKSFKKSSSSKSSNESPKPKTKPRPKHHQRSDT
jgi:histone H3/H4